MKPKIGLIFLKSGLIACLVGLKETWATFTMMPAARHRAAIGRDGAEDRVEERLEQPVESRGGGGVARMRDLGEGRAHRAGDAGNDRGADGDDPDQAGDEHERRR